MEKIWHRARIPLLQAARRSREAPGSDYQDPGQPKDQPRENIGDHV